MMNPLHRTASWLLALSCSLAPVLGCDAATTGGASGGGAGGATTESLVGIWDGPIAVDDRAGVRSHNVLQFGAPDPATGHGPYGIFGEVISGPAFGSRPLLEVAQTGSWWVEDGHVVFDAGGLEPLTANEIFAFSGDALTLQSAQTTKGELEYARSDRCPDPEEREGWSVTSRLLMASVGGTAYGDAMSVGVDSTGRVHVLSGGDSLSYYTRSSGCLWAAYTFGPAHATAALLVAPDDTLHVVGTSTSGFFHYTAPAATARESASSWCPVAPGPLNAAAAGAAKPEVVVDGAGVLWFIGHLVDPASGQPQPNLFRYGGAWTSLGAVPYTAPYPPDLVRLNVDAAGTLHLITREWNTAALHRFEVDPITGLLLEGAPIAAGPLSCPVRDVLIDAAGAVHAACGDPFHGAWGGYLTNAGGDWTLTTLPGVPHGIEQTDDGLLVVGQSVFFQTASGWRAPGPPLTNGTVGPPPETQLGQAVVDAAGNLHFVDAAFYARHAGFPDTASTTLALTFEGATGGELRSDDGQVICTETCEVEVAGGSVLNLEAVDGAVASFGGWSDLAVPGRHQADADGALVVWATGERVELTARWSEGGVGLAPLTIDGMGAPQVGIFDDGSMVVAGGYVAGFTPEAVPLTPLSGPSAPYAMGLAEDGSITWFQSYETGAYGQAVTLLDVGADGTLAMAQKSPGQPAEATFGGARTSEAGLLVGVVDPADGAEIWSHLLELGGQGLPGVAKDLVALPGGGAAVIGDLLDGASGVVLLDGTGEVTGQQAMGPFLMTTAISYEQRTLIAALGTDRVLVGTSRGDSGTSGAELPPQVHVVTTTGELLWSTPDLGGEPVYVSARDGGGAWVVVEVDPQSTHPPTCDTTQDGPHARTLLHLDDAGACTSLVGASFHGQSAVMRSDGLWVSVGLDADQRVGIVTAYNGDLYNGFVGLDGLSSFLKAHVAWSPDGTRLGYRISYATDTYGTDAIGWARFP